MVSTGIAPGWTPQVDGLKDVKFMDLIESCMILGLCLL